MTINLLRGLKQACSLCPLQLLGNGNNIGNQVVFAQYYEDMEYNNKN